MGWIIEHVKGCQQAQARADRIRLAEEIANEIAPKLRLFIRSNTKNKVADVVFQETLRGIFGKLHQFHSNTDGQFWAWCYTIARNEIKQIIRTEAREMADAVAPEVLEELIEAAPPRLTKEDKLDLEFAMNLLRQARPPCYYYLWYSYVLECTNAEIAAEFDLSSADAARMQIDRCLKLVQSLVHE